MVCVAVLCQVISTVCDAGYDIVLRLHADEEADSTPSLYGLVSQLTTGTDSCPFILSSSNHI